MAADSPISGSAFGSWDTGNVTTPQAAPEPKPAKSRLLQDGRDMFWSMAPLVLVCIVLAGVLGMCSFAPNGPGQAPVLPYDTSAALQADADALEISIRMPRLPEGWRANSGSRASIDGGRTDPAGKPARAVVSRTGFLAPTGMFISLIQSDADEPSLVRYIDNDLAPTGTQDVNGVRWIVYEGGEDSQPVWTTRLKGPTGPAQIAVTGPAGTDEYRTLAAATQSQPPLPVR
ncbi:membrane protein [Mycobacterium antarcticum]|nr:membrane protein [Mycolicibacterium sp. TUM20983]